MHVRVYQGLVDKADIIFDCPTCQSIGCDSAGSTKFLDKTPEDAYLAALHLRPASAPITGGTLTSLQQTTSSPHELDRQDISTSSMECLLSHLQKQWSGANVAIFRSASIELKKHHSRCQCLGHRHDTQESCMLIRQRKNFDVDTSQFINRVLVASSSKIAGTFE